MLRVMRLGPSISMGMRGAMTQTAPLRLRCTSVRQMLSWSLSSPAQPTSRWRTRWEEEMRAFMLKAQSQPSLRQSVTFCSLLQSPIDSSDPAEVKQSVEPVEARLSQCSPDSSMKWLSSWATRVTFSVFCMAMMRPSAAQRGTLSVSPMSRMVSVPGAWRFPVCRSNQQTSGKQTLRSVLPCSMTGAAMRAEPMRNWVSSTEAEQALSSRGKSKKRGRHMEPMPFLLRKMVQKYLRREQRSLRLVRAACSTVSPSAQGSCETASLALWLRQKVQSDPSWNHRAHSSSVVLPPNPQMSAPTIWNPKNWLLKLSAIELFRYSQLAQLSPVQWKPNLLDPNVDDRVMMKGRSLWILRNTLVEWVSRKALKACTSASTSPPQWVALRGMVWLSTPSSPGWQGRSFEQSKEGWPSGVEQGPSQKLASSFMSSHTPENFTLAQRRSSWSIQYLEALGWKKSTKVVSPGQTLPFWGLPEPASLMKMSLLSPSWQASPLVLMPASMIGTYRYLSVMAFMRSRGNLLSSMVKSSQSTMQSMSLHTMSRGMPFFSKDATMSSSSPTFLQPHRHWWQPRLQKGGMADRPTQKLSFSRVSSGLSSPRMKRKSSTPPMTLKVMQCLPPWVDLMRSIALELRRQLTWKTFLRSRIMQKGQQPQVCLPSPLSTTWPRSRLKTVHLPSCFLKESRKRSPIPQAQSLSTCVLTSMYLSLYTKSWSQVENSTARFCLRRIFMLKGLKVYSTWMAEKAMGQVKLPRGSMGKMSVWGTSKREFWASVNLRSKSLKPSIRSTTFTRLTMGLLGLPQYSSLPMYCSSSLMDEALLTSLMISQSEAARARQPSSSRASSQLRRMDMILIHPTANRVDFISPTPLTYPHRAFIIRPKNACRGLVKPTYLASL